ncbi:MAG: DUF5615 family PIN-like protein [Candidatus Brocadiales bacterium]
MHFLVDECTGPAVARWLRKQKHEVFSVYEEARGMDDDGIIQKSFAERWILIKLIMGSQIFIVDKRYFDEHSVKMKDLTPKLASKHKTSRK